MKLFAPALIFCGAAAFGQSPQVPHKMHFAGMTLTIRDDARREIQVDVDALTRSPKYFNIKVERARTYFPTIEKAFAEERLPDDFKYLSLQESALIANAVSSSDAVGFWQFKDFTAQEMGLRVDSDVDERMNIASASRGAAKYLKQCNHYFNNWVYALQAYNMGAGGVMRAVGDKDLGTRHMEINGDTHWYVKKFLAHKVAFEGAVAGKPQVELSAVKVSGKSLGDIAKATSVDEQKLRDFNVWIKGDRIPDDKEYLVMVPSGTVQPDFDVLTVASAAKPAGTSKPQHDERTRINGVLAVRAAKGESLQAIASRSGIGISAFLRYNDMAIDKPIQGDAFYFIEKKKKRAERDLYTLQAGEDLWSVSQRFGMTEKSLAKFNRLEKNERVRPGTTLYLATRKPLSAGTDEGPVLQVDEESPFEWGQPAGVRLEASAIVPGVAGTSTGGKKSINSLENSAETATTSLHVVQAEETIYSVARKYGVTIQQLMEWNNKKDFSVSVGEKLKINGR